ncbi:Ppx/GppA family phosphatase [Naumannella halotolerans]|uniref:Exopolyphosphatase/guanosine-5'-triphosphate, 3'-diphosphate pyrophosphatase n=1 Tax=Naumannella halotolerans TaxID=993414 RepID=A0A4R7J0S1_9ACTN|nr:Ppx/GppA phosphatase family protein [Naumannella halotolerans]TDT29976.1 exopolyphosphatase/guanosine-5'-triphosphate,3'-diphosphate pyrophosphatase [Naumannella halotolerans]
MRLGVLDVGSNTVHLLVVDARPGGAPSAAASHKWPLRLAEHLDADGAIDDEAVGLLADTLTECRVRADDAGCAELLTFVTSAVREAVNGEQVLAQVRQRSGVSLEVMSGRDEARVTFLAARRWFGWSAGKLAVFDIGGGSLEIAGGPDEDPDVALSVPLGAGRMYREFGDDLAAMRRHARITLGAVIGDLSRHGPFDRAVGTSKTFRALGRITGAAPRSEGPFVTRRLERHDLQQWMPKLAEMEISDRAKLPGVSLDRAPQILAGAVVAESVMDLFGVNQLILCPWALREGVLLRHMDHLTNGSGRHD